MILDAVDAHRLKGAVAYVQRDFGDLDAVCHERGQERGGEVQSRCRGGDGPALARKDGLVAIAIGRAVSALDVRRQRHVTNGVNGVGYRLAVLGPETDDPPSEEVPLEHLTM